MHLSRYLRRTQRKEGRKAFVPSAIRRILPVGTKGLNGKDALATMKPDFSLTCTNLFPVSNQYLESRSGSDLYYKSGVETERVETLINHNNNEFLIIANDELRNITNPNNVSVLKSGLQNSYFSYNSFNSWGYLLNGEDTPLRLNPDGSLNPKFGFSEPNLNVRTLTSAFPFKNRLFFTQKNSSTIYYGAIGHIGNTEDNTNTAPLTPYPLGQVHPKGGNVTGITSLTLDAGDGIDDYFLVFFENGDALLYQGENIDSIYGSWFLRGRYEIGKLIGNRPFVRLGAETIAITELGFIPLSVFILDAKREERFKLSDKIENFINQAVQRYKGIKGWETILNASENQLIFNIPTAGASFQYVMNINTGAWCNFEGLNALCWIKFKDRLFFGTPTGRVMEANRGETDKDELNTAGKAIETEFKGAFNNFKRANSKDFEMIKPYIEATGEIDVSLGINVDFSNDNVLSSRVLTQPFAVSPWDMLTWETWRWRREASSRVAKDTWTMLNKGGVFLSLHLKADVTSRYKLFASEVSFINNVGIG